MPGTPQQKTFHLTRPGQAVLVARSAPEEAWIVIAMVGEDDSPVKDEAYRIELPDGSVREGTLDANGEVTIDNIDVPGTCILTFPDLDVDAFQLIP